MYKGCFVAMICLLVFSSAVYSQQIDANQPDVRLSNTEKREIRRNLVIKEWNTDVTGKRIWLDRITTYNTDGYKIEEIEYASYGQKFRNTFQRNALNQCIEERNYDSKNKLQRIIKYTYTPDGIRKEQLNYLPNGKLYSTKRFEYIEVDSK
jgi:hypothetical protein